MWEAHTLSVSAYYRASDDVIQNVSYMENNILYSTFDNVTDSKRAGVELVGRNKLFKVLDLTTTVNLYYYNMSGFDYKYNDNQNFYY